MDYYIRVFCIADQVPTLVKMLDWLKAHDAHMEPQSALGADQLETRDWSSVALAYKPDKSPIVVECHRSNGEQACAKKELEGFIKRIGPAGKSYAKRRVLEHLNATKYIIACRMPLDDIDDAGWDANGQVLTFFRDHSRALIQADREGFYEGSSLLLKME